MKARPLTMAQAARLHRASKHDTQPCPKCKGEGSKDPWGESCDVCGGSGSVRKLGPIDERSIE